MPLTSSTTAALHKLSYSDRASSRTLRSSPWPVATIHRYQPQNTVEISLAPWRQVISVGIEAVEERPGLNELPAPTLWRPHQTLQEAAEQHAPDRFATRRHPRH